MKAKRRKINICLLALVLVLILPACEAREEGQKDKPIVYASFLPIYSMVDAVAGDLVDLRCFMPMSASVHDWEPSPKAMKDLAQADMLIVNGANLESWLDQVKTNLPDLKIVNMADNVDLIRYTGQVALGEFQLMQRLDLGEGKNQISFGHTHEDYLRIAFIKDNGDRSMEDLIAEGRRILEDQGDLVDQNDTIQVGEAKAYKLTMSHESGQIYFQADPGPWIVFTDRKPEEILDFDFQDMKGNDLSSQILVESSSKDTDKVSFDPHSWLSINNAKSYMGTIAREITKLIPEAEKTIGKNRFKAVDDLTLLQYEYQDKFKDIDPVKREFIVMHYAFAYLARDFDLIQYPLQGLTSMEDPSIRSMVKAITYARDKGIKTIYYEYGKPSSVEEVIAEELDGGEIASLASMEYTMAGEALDQVSYYDLMKMNLENLYQNMLREEEIRDDK